MRSIRFIAIFLGALALLLPGLSRAEDSIYIVKASDTFSEIAHTFFGAPVYASGGTMKRLLSLNPQIKNPNLIFPGQEIHMDAMAKAAGEFHRANEARQLASEEKVQACEVIEPPKFKATSHISLNTSFEYFRVDATDVSTKAPASFLSRMSPSVTAAWVLDWTPEWSSKFSLKYRSEKSAGVVGKNKQLNGADGSSFGVSAELDRHWAEGSTSHIALRRQEEIFLYSTNTTSVDFDRVGIMSIVLGHEQRIIHADMASLGIGAEAAYLFSAQGLTYDVNSGLLGKGYAYIEHKREGMSIRGETFYQYQKQNTSLTEQSEKTVGFSIGLIWTLP